MDLTTHYLTCSAAFKTLGPNLLVATLQRKNFTSERLEGLKRLEALRELVKVSSKMTYLLNVLPQPRHSPLQQPPIHLNLLLTHALDLQQQQRWRSNALLHQAKQEHKKITFLPLYLSCNNTRELQLLHA